MVASIDGDMFCQNEPGKLLTEPKLNAVLVAFKAAIDTLLGPILQAFQLVLVLSFKKSKSVSGVLIRALLAAINTSAELNADIALNC
jgi:hypothetical protein